jgi:hypothetical protein
VEQEVQQQMVLLETLEVQVAVVVALLLREQQVATETTAFLAVVAEVQVGLAHLHKLVAMVVLV